MIKAIIFDVDGVLVDSKKANIAFFKKIIKKAGYPAVSEKDILKCFHLPLWQSLEKLTGNTDQEEIKRVFGLAKDPSLRNPALFEFPEQFEETLEALHDKYKMAIVTSRIRVGIDDLFSAREIKHLFDVVVTFEDYKNPKPHPEPLEVALEKLNLSPKEAIYIGDSPTDIEAANAAGMLSIYLSAKVHANATKNIKVFYELVKVIDRLQS